MGKRTPFDYARLAVQAEQRFLELLEKVECRESVPERPNEDLPKCVRPHPDSNSSR